MAMVDLLTALRRDAEAEVAAILAAADDHVTTLLASASRDRDERVRLGVERGRRELQAASDARVAEAASAARRVRLEARREMLERVRAAARAKLAALLARPELAATLVDVALAAAGDRAAQIRCPAIMSAAARERARGLPIEIDPACSSGVIVGLRDGKGEIEATLEAYFDRAWPRLQIVALDLVAEVAP